MPMLMEKVQAEWDKYANFSSRLPTALRERHAEIYARALVQARDKGWVRNWARMSKGTLSGVLRRFV